MTERSEAAGARCIYCGKPNRYQHGYCSTGCDLAGRIPRGEAVLPATRQLGMALAWGVLVFNQILFAGMSSLLYSRGEFETAGTFGMASVIIGVFSASSNCVLFYVSRPKRAGDWAALVASLALGALVAKRPIFASGEALVMGFAVANLLFGLWLSRGLWSLRASKKGQKE